MKKFNLTNVSSEDLIEQILLTHKSVEFKEFENGVVTEFSLIVDKKEIITDISIRLCLEQYFDLN